VSESEWVVYNDTVIFSNCQFIMRNQQAFVMTQSDQCSSTVTLLLVRFSVATTPAGRLPARERNTMTRKRRKIRLRTSHIPITVLYTPTATSRQPKDQNITERREFRTQATRPAGNRPLSPYGHQSAYCWAQTEPSLLRAIPIRIQLSG